MIILNVLLCAVPEAVSHNIIRKNGQRAPRYKPALYADEIGLTSDKYIHLNDTVEELPLKISIGPMSTQRWFLMSHLEESLSAQKGFGFSDKDIDDVRRMITDTSLTFLLVTIIASVLHLLFEFLAFQSDISFWSHNKSLAGLSTRTVITDLISQVIVFLFLLDSDTSILVIIPSFVAIMIQVWKVQKATGLTVTLARGIEFQRWQTLNNTQAPTISDASAAIVGSQEKDSGNDSTQSTIDSQQQVATLSGDDQLAKVSLEADRVATIFLGSALLPIVLIFILRSLIYEKHASWYSWAIGSLTGSVYAFGFVFMCPQLYINHQLKSVSHLPWQYLIYKFLNTFVDGKLAHLFSLLSFVMLISCRFVCIYHKDASNAPLVCFSR